MTRLVGAVDIGASKTLVAVRALPIAEWPVGVKVVRFATPRSPSECTDRISEALTALANDASGELVAVGCGTPGPLNRDLGLVLHSPNQGWHDVSIGPRIAEMLEVPVLIDDDGRAGALGEARLGAAAGADPMVYITVGTGIGSGVVVGGHLVHGSHGVAGEVGHLVVHPRGPRCSCGNRGCVEVYAGGDGLERRALATWRGTRRPDGIPAPRTATEVFAAARHGDPRARRLVGEAVHALAFAIAAVSATIDPMVIVIGGSLGLAQRGVVNRAVRAARLLCINEGGVGPRAVPASLGGESVLAGAALLGQDAAGTLR